jgi:hypothetical protein
MASERQFPIARQPDDITCGPTCLASIYDYYGDAYGLDEVIADIPMLEGGGTLAVVLACHALRRGYKAWIYTFNLEVFDPTWFMLDNAELVRRLEKQMEFKKKAKLRVASEAYIEFLRLGGRMKMHDLSPSLIGDYLLQGVPILTGLSSTYLYKSSREVGDYPVPDDIRGEPQGHFVVLTSYDPDENAVTVADPYHPESMNYGLTYHINMEHLICAILLGVVTYDGNLLIITK